MPDIRRNRHLPKPDRRRALALLASCPDGYTEAMMMAHGFTVEQLVELVKAGLATTSTQHILIGKRSVEVTRARITDAGRRVLADQFSTSRVR